MDESLLLALLCGTPVLLIAALAFACGPGKVFGAMTCVFLSFLSEERVCAAQFFNSRRAVCRAGLAARWPRSTTARTRPTAATTARRATTTRSATEVGGALGVRA